MNNPTHMRAALALARRGLGTTWPNPSVGCVVVANGRVVGRGRTQPGGRPHAETQALAMAGAAARGADAYVTLEPCNHTGQTPPCTEALIAAGVARVAIAGNDPDRRVDGAGIARLREAGIEVVTGMLTAEADELQAGFLHRIRLGRPLVTLKLATTLDGRIGTHDGESQWITGGPARELAHAMRGRSDAVMAGIGTVTADNPLLTCRIPGFRNTPMVRIVVDSHLRTRLTAKLVATAASDPTWIVHRNGVPADRRAAFTDAGVRLIDAGGGERGVDLKAAMQALGDLGLTRVLVEGGAKLAAGLLRDGLVDRIAWFHAPAIAGGDGWPAAQPFGVIRLTDMPRFIRTGARTVGDDMLTEFARLPDTMAA
jgi:diaminohydroxyphosphoribosylaminopyrimidine deaminase/5-amino-6-(5-phosphoribosylamino)uracil reductase